MALLAALATRYRYKISASLCCPARIAFTVPTSWSTRNTTLCHPVGVRLVVAFSACVPSPAGRQIAPLDPIFVCRGASTS